MSCRPTAALTPSQQCQWRPPRSETDVTPRSFERPQTNAKGTANKSRALGRRVNAVCKEEKRVYSRACVFGRGVGRGRCAASRQCSKRWQCRASRCCRVVDSRRVEWSLAPRRRAKRSCCEVATLLPPPLPFRKRGASCGPAVAPLFLLICRLWLGRAKRAKTGKVRDLLSPPKKT